MRISRRSNYWSGWWQTKYYPIPVIIPYLEEIVNTLSVVDVHGVKGLYNKTVISSLSIIGDLLVELSNNITETVTATSTLSSTIYKALEIVESFNSTTSLQSRINAVNTILELLRTVSTAYYGLSATIIESLVISETKTLLYTLLNRVLEELNVNSTISVSSLLLTNLSSSISASDTLSSRSIFKALIDEEFLITIPGVSGQDTYLSYLLSPETNSVSTYTNYNFNGCTPFKGKYLFYNKTGLYEYGGDLDDTDKIRSELETVAFNFKSSNLKQVPSVYLGVSSTDNFILKVRVDGKAEVLYKLNKHTSNLQTQKIDIGKGLIGRYFQFELITEASEFNLESIDFYPIELRRKL